MAALKSSCFAETNNSTGAARFQRTSASKTGLLPLSSGAELHIGKPKLSQTVVTEPFSSKSSLSAQSSPLSSTSTIRCDPERGAILTLKAKSSPWRLDFPQENYGKPLSSSFSSYIHSTAANQIEYTQLNLEQPQDGPLVSRSPPTNSTMSMNSLPIMNSDQYHPGGGFSQAGDSVPINSDSFAFFNHPTFNRNAALFSQLPTMEFFQDRDTHASSTEAAPLRFTSAPASSFTAPLPDRNAPSRVEPDGRSSQLSTDFIHEPSLLRTNYPITSQKDWFFPFNDFSQTLNSIDPQALRGVAVGESEFSRKPSFDLLSFIASNALDDNSQSLENGNALEKSYQHQSYLDSLFNHSQGAMSVKREPSESDFDGRNPLPLNPHDSVKHENNSEDYSVHEKTASPPQLSSSSSNSSSQSSSPSLSSSPCSNKNLAGGYSSFYPLNDLNNLDETCSIFKNLTNSFPPQVGNQSRYQQGSLEEFLNAGQYTNTLESNYPLQLQTTKQQPPSQQHQQQQQQFWHQQELLQQTENIPFSTNTTEYPNGLPTYFQKTTFICPKCGKGHTRQSNLLAHLRDTHSDVKKVFCDVPGCTKSYKRISECRRHKKDFHGIPLPSELNGKLRKPRSTLSSIRLSKFKHAH